jgi:hypothetical protein
MSMPLLALIMSRLIPCDGQHLLEYGMFGGREKIEQSSSDSLPTIVSDGCESESDRSGLTSGHTLFSESFETK